jgi:hypothetical protein
MGRISVHVELTVRLRREGEGVAHRETWLWFDEQQCCIDAPLNVCSQFAIRLGMVEDPRACSTQWPMAYSTLGASVEEIVNQSE